MNFNFSLLRERAMMCARMILLAVAGGSALALAGVPARAAPAADPAVAAAAAVDGAHAAGDDKVICRRTETTGSNIPGPRVCATARVWRQRARDDQDFTTDFVMRAHTAQIPENGVTAVTPMTLKGAFGR